MNDTAGGTGELGRTFSDLYDELRTLAGRAMAGEREEHTLQPTALVHEVYLRLARTRRIDVSDRARFLGLAAKVMRQVLVDHARSRRRAKRGAGLPVVSLGTSDFARTEIPLPDVLAVNEALMELGKIDAAQERIVEMRFFGGLLVDEVAEALGVSATTVKRESAMAQAWLAHRLREVGPDVGL